MTLNTLLVKYSEEEPYKRKGHAVHCKVWVPPTCPLALCDRSFGVSSEACCRDHDGGRDGYTDGGTQVGFRRRRALSGFWGFWLSGYPAIRLSASGPLATWGFGVDDDAARRDT